MPARGHRAIEEQESGDEALYRAHAGLEGAVDDRARQAPKGAVGRTEANGAVAALDARGGSFPLFKG